MGLREYTCISCQPLSVISTPLRACSNKEAATKENPQNNSVYLRNTPQFPVGTKIFAAHVMHLQSRLRMQFNIISKPTPNDHISAGSEPLLLLWTFHLSQTSGSITSKLHSDTKTLTSFYSVRAFLIQLPSQPSMLLM